MMPTKAENLRTRAKAILALANRDSEWDTVDRRLAATLLGLLAHTLLDEADRLDGKPGAPDGHQRSQESQESYHRLMDGLIHANVEAARLATRMAVLKLNLEQLVAEGRALQVIDGWYASQPASTDSTA